MPNPTEELISILNGTPMAELDPERLTLVCLWCARSFVFPQRMGWPRKRLLRAIKRNGAPDYQGQITAAALRYTDSDELGVLHLFAQEYVLLRRSQKQAQTVDDFVLWSAERFLYLDVQAEILQQVLDRTQVFILTKAKTSLN